MLHAVATDSGGDGVTDDGHDDGEEDSKTTDGGDGSAGACVMLPPVDETADKGSVVPAACKSAALAAGEAMSVQYASASHECDPA